MVGPLLGIYKIKYETLNNILKLNEDVKSVNFHINLHSILSVLYTNAYEVNYTNRRGDDAEIVLTSILSTVAHYRGYFGYKDIKNKVYLYFNTELPEYQNKLIPFGGSYYDKYCPINQKYFTINNMIKKVIEDLQTILEYIPGVYFIHNKGIEDGVAMSYVREKHEADLNIAFTKKEIDFQLVSENTVILRPKREQSTVITTNTLYDFLTKKTKYSAEDLSYKFYPLVLAVWGYKAYDIEKMNTSFTKLLKLIQRAYEHEVLHPDMGLQRMVKEFNDLTAGGEGNLEVLTKRINAITYSAVERGMAHNKFAKIYNSFIDLSDINTLEKINNHFMPENKVNIYTLLNGTSASNKKKPNIDWRN
jgi:hypothetical protein